MSSATDDRRPAQTGEARRSFFQLVLANHQAGLVGVILLLVVVLALTAGGNVDARTAATVNNFYNVHTLLQTATDASFFAIMAVGATIVIISGGIDLSVGSIYALSGVAMAMVLRASASPSSAATVAIGLVMALGVG